MLRKVIVRSLFVLGLTVAGHAFADTPPKNDPPPGEKGGDGDKGGGSPPAGVYLSIEEYERLKGGKKGEKDDPPKGGGSGDGDDDLQAKARKEKEDAAKSAASVREIEKAVQFNSTIEDFIVKNASLLPESITRIVKLANKETYDTGIAKASALKAAIVQEYFQVQANVDALTVAQKQALDDYLKLTKTGKETKAADVYENIFEPALELTRRVKKAEEVGRSRAGMASTSEAELSYKEKLVRRSRAAHLGEKEEARK